VSSETRREAAPSPRVKRPEPVGSNRVRTVLAVLLFGGLAALEIEDGLDRLADARDRRRRELLEVVDAQLEPLVREVGEQFGDGRRHALHLARHPMVAALLRAPGGDGDELGRVLRPYLASFPEIDRLRILDRDARERFRCERMGGAVATLPASLLDPEPSPELAALAKLAVDMGGADGAALAVSPLSYDSERVEVEATDRRVFHLVAAVRPVRAGDEDEDDALGVVVVTIYASPLLHALAAFEPLPGTSTCLLDADGRDFTPTSVGGEPESRSGQLLAAAPSVRRRVLEGERRIASADALFFARATGVEPASYLVSAVPMEAFAPGLLAGEGLWTALRTLLVLAAIGLGSAFFVRASQRAARLLETERYAKRIREESEKQRALMEAAADMILIVQPEAEIVEDWNPRARELFGLGDGRAPLPLGPIAGALEGADGERLAEGIRAASRREGAVVVAGLALVRGDVRHDLDARCVGIDYGGRRLVELSLSDRTRERELERRARTAERLSALGLLTAGVAHEINNPLEGIGNYLALLERSNDPEKRATYLAQVRRGFQRIGEITGELLPLARPLHEGDESGDADIARVVERSVSMARLSRELRGVEVRVEGLDEPRIVRGSEGGLEQILLNLLLNAGRAMDGAGVVLVRARLGRAGDGGHADGRELELLVEDDGPGIAEGDLERVFDPFFTRSGGTGLGLSVSYQIAKAHGGDLAASNRPEGGARFCLRLPLAAPEEERT
jgi:signal transduction histidine kinase